MPSSRVLVVVVVLLTLAACSSTELLYRNADWLAQRWVNGLVDANAAQRDAWRESFRQTMAVHRDTLLPELIGLLDALEAEVDRGLAPHRLHCLLDATDRLYRAHARLAVPVAVQVLGDLSPTQRGHLTEELAERNREYAEDYLDDDPKRREQARIDRYVERIERWTGALTTTQLSIVEQSVRAMPDVADDWLGYRRQQQQHLLELLHRPVDEQHLRRFLSAWWVELADRPPALLAKTEQTRADGVRLALRLDDMLTAQQRAEFRDRLADLRTDLEDVLQHDPPVQVTQAGLLACDDVAQAQR